MPDREVRRLDERAALLELPVALKRFLGLTLRLCGVAAGGRGVPLGHRGVALRRLGGLLRHGGVALGGVGLLGAGVELHAAALGFGVAPVIIPSVGTHYGPVAAELVLLGFNAAMVTTGVRF